MSLATSKIFEARKAAEVAKLYEEAAERVAEIAKGFAHDAALAAHMARCRYLQVVFQQGFCPACVDVGRPLTSIDENFRCKAGHDHNIARAGSDALAPKATAADAKGEAPYKRDETDAFDGGRLG